MQAEAIEKILVGQRVYTRIYARGRGVVYAIHGEQSPESVRRIGDVISMGGRAEVDIVFESGFETKRLPESILRGVQWTILPDVVSADVIRCMREYCAQETVRKEADAKSKAEEFAKAVAALRVDERYKHLQQVGDTDHGSKLVATNIRREFKSSFSGVKFSVRTDGYGAVRIAWIDGPTVQQVEAITGKYSGGHFDGTEDIYRHERSPWTEVFGSAKYISESRQHSPAAMMAAVDAVCAKYGWPLIEVKTSEYDGHAYLNPPCPNPSEEHQLRMVYDFLEQKHEFAQDA